MRFEWDGVKNKLNYLKHGVWFEEARLVFYDRQYRFYFDHIHSESEDRYLAIGMCSNAYILVVSHAYRQESIRIISARKADKKEKEFYNGRRIRLL